MSAWWTAQGILKTALRAPFKSARASLFVFSIFVLPILLPVLAIKALGLGLLGRNIGSTFFAPDGAVDPVMLQHLLWLSGRPEVVFLFLCLLVPVIAWAQAVWIKGQSGRVTLMAGWGHWARIMGIYLTIVIAMVMIGAVSFVLPLVFILAPLVALFVMFRFAPVMAEMSGGASPAWRYSNVGFAVIVWCVVDFIILFVLLGIPGGIIHMSAQTTLAQTGGPSYVGLQSQLFLAFAINCLAVVYGLFVLTAVIFGIARKGVAGQASLFR